MPPKSVDKNKAKKKKTPDEDTPLPADLIKKFKKPYNDACKNAGIVPLKSLMKAIDEALEEEKFLERIVLNMDGFGEVGFRAFTQGIKGFNFLKQLVIWNVGIGDSGISAVVEFLHDNKVLESLEIIDNITAVGCAILSEHFKNPGTVFLSALTMDYNGIGDEGAAIMSAGLKEYPLLKKASFNYCHIGAAGGVAIIVNLLGPDSKCIIENLSLQGNVCGPQTLAVFGTILTTNTTLISINLCDNGIGEDEEPLENFRNGLLMNTKLKEVNLDQNVIGEKGTMQILEVIGGPRQDILDFRVCDKIPVTLQIDRKSVV